MTYLHSIFKLANHFDYQLFSYAGVQQDKSQLAEKYPTEADEINSLPDKAIKWLALRFIEPSTIQETHPLPDCLPTVKNYILNQSAISQKYNSQAAFKAQIDDKISPIDRPWSNPADFIKMTVDEMESILHILTLSRAPKGDKVIEGIKAGVEYTPPEEDRVGRVGEWDIWLPSNKENSCKIARYDVNTLEPETTWCTARTSGSNLFYNYNNANTMLFYIIKQRPDPKMDNDYLSVGFFNGEPSLRGMDGSESVNRTNVGLTPEKLETILGSNYHPIMKIMQDKATSLNGKSPGFSKIEDAATSLPKLKSLIRGNTKDETKRLIGMMLESCTNFSGEVVGYLANNNYLQWSQIRDFLDRGLSFDDSSLKLLKEKYFEYFIQNNNNYTIAVTFLEALNNNKKYFTDEAVEILKQKFLIAIESKDFSIRFERFDPVINNPEVLNANDSEEAKSLLASKLLQGFRKNFSAADFENIVRSNHKALIFDNQSFLSELKKIILNFLSIDFPSMDFSSFTSILETISDVDISFFGKDIKDLIKLMLIKRLSQKENGNGLLLDSISFIHSILGYNSFSCIPNSFFQNSDSDILKDERVIKTIKDEVKESLNTLDQQVDLLPDKSPESRGVKNLIYILSQKVINFRFADEEMKQIAFNLFFKVLDKADLDILETSYHPNESIIEDPKFLQVVTNNPMMLDKLREKIKKLFDSYFKTKSEKHYILHTLHYGGIEPYQRVYSRLVNLAQYGIITQEMLDSFAAIVEYAKTEDERRRLEREQMYAGASPIQLANKFYKTAINFLYRK